MLIKQKSPPLPRNLALRTFDQLPIVFSEKVNLLCLLYSTARSSLLHLIKQSCLMKTFVRTLILVTISLAVFSSKTNLKLHNYCVTPKMIKKVIPNFDLSKTSGPSCIPLVILKNWEHELSYILPEVFNKCLKEFCFPDYWKASSVVPVFKNVGERSTSKSYGPVSFFFCVKSWEKL